MAKIMGFLDYPGEEFVKDSIKDRIKHFHEFERSISATRIKTQAGRCMDCGVPFCNWGCPVKNLIPEFAGFVYKGHWKEAYECLKSTNNFPEFTGRLCPAPCEPACCVNLTGDPVSIKQIEFSIIENAFNQGWVQPVNVEKRLPISVAIIGSGSAGLAATQQLNYAGYNVTIFEKNEVIGGLLTLGITDFKIEYKTIKRRIDILKQEGVNFKTGIHVGQTISGSDLKKQFDVIGLCCGVEKPREIQIPGDDKKGVYFAMDFLIQQNRYNLDNNFIRDKSLIAEGKHVIILGGEDTGSDCVGTSIRQNAASVTQIQIHKKLPMERYDTNPWPEWPKVFSTSSSQEEGGVYKYSLLAQEILGDSHITGLRCMKIGWPKG